MTRAQTSAPMPHWGQPPSTVTKWFVFTTDLMIVSSSSGRSERRFTTCFIKSITYRCVHTISSVKEWSQISDLINNDHLSCTCFHIMGSSWCLQSKITIKPSYTIDWPTKYILYISTHSNTAIITPNTTHHWPTHWQKHSGIYKSMLLLSIICI